MWVGGSGAGAQMASPSIRCPKQGSGMLCSTVQSELVQICPLQNCQGQLRESLGYRELRVVPFPPPRKWPAYLLVCVRVCPCLQDDKRPFVMA
jgi:hypothetical protein